MQHSAPKIRASLEFFDPPSRRVKIYFFPGFLNLKMN
jgi:hypothetical protein